MTDDEIRKVENIVNAEMLANAATETRVMPIAEAQKLGAMMLFGEKYGDDVRVLDIGSSRELCGGTTFRRTGDIGLFKITVEGGVAAGVRRVEAVTGDNALALVQQQKAMLDVAAAASRPGRRSAGQDRPGAGKRPGAGTRTGPPEIQAGCAGRRSGSLRPSRSRGAKVLAATLEGADVTALRETMDKLKDKLKSAAIVLSSVADGKVTLIAGVTADLTGKVKAGELVNLVAQQVGGKGGGRP